MIASRIRDAIARGDIAPGTQLSEARFAAELGVSRGPLREGLQRLTQEGLLISIRNRGLFVIEMTPDNVTDTYLAREAVETAAASAIHRGDPVVAGADLMALVDKMAGGARRRSTAAVGAADIAFHEALVAAARSPRLSRMHATLITETRMCIHALEETYADKETRVEEHREIAQSFIDRKPELTRRLLVAHMQDALTRLTPADAGSMAPTA